MQPRAPSMIIFDDDPDVGALLALVAQEAGYSPAIVSDFEEFQRRYNSETRLIVLDLVMPRVDGIEVIRFLASHRSPAGLILVSAADRKILSAAEALATAHGLWLVDSFSKTVAASRLKRLLPEIRLDARAPGTRHAIGSAITATREELARAIGAGELEVFYQPLVNITDGGLDSVEALVRWRHPEHGLLLPHQFIPLAERYALIDGVTDEVLDRSLAQLAAWGQSGVTTPVSINVSALSLKSLDLPDRIAGVAARHEIGLPQITIEVTESWFIADTITALDILTRLRIKGFGLAIDDFGTGYATLSRLKQIPFNKLKIDQTFIKGARRSPEARLIAHSSVSLGQRLDMQVVAEGIENGEDWKLANELACDVAQGFYIAEPMTGSDLLTWIQRNEPLAFTRRSSEHGTGQIVDG